MVTRRCQLLTYWTKFLEFFPGGHFVAGKYVVSPLISLRITNSLLGARSPGQKFRVCKYNTPEKKFKGSFQNKTPDNFLKMEHLQNSRSISDKTPGGF